MLVELSLIPLGTGEHLSPRIAEALNIVEESGLPYQLTPSGTCIEGEWNEVISLVRRCHEKMRESSAHVITLIKIEDEEGARNKLTANVASVREKMAKRPKGGSTQAGIGSPGSKLVRQPKVTRRRGGVVIQPASGGISRDVRFSKA